MNEGFEVIKADGANAEEMERALAGSWGAFINVATEVRPSTKIKRTQATDRSPRVKNSTLLLLYKDQSCQALQLPA